ncbi:MAG: TolC family protein [Candidatus Hydrogenedentes bacterium]|nr:TolC family protein [Candidatus Hydrogenedentota bacterium]
MSHYPQVTEPESAFGEDADSEVGHAILSLEAALSLAVQHNRQYQTQKETVYLRGLELTLDRHQFTPIWGGSAAGEFRRRTRDELRDSKFTTALGDFGDVIQQLEGLTGQPADLLRQWADVVEQAGAVAGLANPDVRIVDERDVTGDASVGVNWLLKSGGEIAINFTTNFLRFLTGDPTTTSSSALIGSFTQPLLRGAGSDVAAERLLQSERNMLYALRSFARFRKEFTVQVCSSYYDVLQSRDIVRNNWVALQNFRRQVERERAFADEGRRTPAELGRLKQAELSRQNAWIDSVRRYRAGLDEFKILLGLSTDVPIALDSGELDALRQSGLQHPTIAAEDATEVALVARLDLYNSRDEADDATRRVEVAANALLPQLDAVIAGSMTTPDGGNFNDLDRRRAEWSGGLALDPDFDRLPERNAYRAALIAEERAGREVSLAVDTVKLEVRDAWRNLDQARSNYEIALAGVELNERRVEEQELLAELGRATVLDQVDAQNDLTDAQNDLTAALVSHRLALLAFWRDMGILYIKENGQWEDVVDAPPGLTADQG